MGNNRGERLDLEGSYFNHPEFLMQESISRGGKIQFQTFDTSLYGTAHPTGKSE